MEIGKKKGGFVVYYEASACEILKSVEKLLCFVL